MSGLTAERDRRESDGDVLARLRRRRCSVIYRARAAAAALLLLPSVTGCYQYVPVTVVTPPAGTEVALDISDRGRVALAGQVGPGVRRLRGRLIQAGDSAYVVGLSAVEYLGASTVARWSGEVVSVSRDYVTTVTERQLSRRRSWLAAGILVVAAAAVSTLAITGFGSEGGDNRVPPDGGEQ
jgi:hypothetical protein